MTTEACPTCGTTRVAEDQFCEGCGYDFVTRSDGTSRPFESSLKATWEIVVTADRTYFDSLETESIAFPSNYPPKPFVLEAERVGVGRKSAAGGIEPEIDLSGNPEDTGISHLHAQFLRGDDGTYSLIDLDSTNGTSVNDGPPIAPGIPVPLADGDRVHVGAWTTITVRVGH